MVNASQLDQSANPEERRNQLVVNALISIANAITSLKSEVHLLVETVKTFKPLS